MRLRIPPHYVLIFAVRGKKMMRGIYTPQSNSYADYFSDMRVWIAQIGPECRIVKEGVKVGDQCLMRDAFELDPLPVQDLSSYPIPEDCRKEALDTDGIIEINRVHEDAILAVCEREDVHGGREPARVGRLQA